MQIVNNTLAINIANGRIQDENWQFEISGCQGNHVINVKIVLVLVYKWYKSRSGMIMHTR